MYAVLLMTVFWDLIWGVLVGMFIANLLTVDGITQSQLQGMEDDNLHPEERTGPWSADEQRLIEACGNQLMLFRLRGPLSFGAAKGISSRIAWFEYPSLILDLSEVPRLGVTAALAIERMVIAAHNRNRFILISGARPEVQTRLAKFGIREEIRASRLQALQEAAQRHASS